MKLNKEMLERYSNRIIQVLVVLIVILAFLYATAVEENKTSKSEKEKYSIAELQDSIDKMQQNIQALKEPEEEYSDEYTGTIPPFTYTADIVNIDLEDNSLYGITSNKSTYSGLMRYDCSTLNIEGIELYSAYNLTCKPLIRDTKNGEKITPYVEVISIEKSSQQDIDKMNESKEELSRYIEFKVRNELKTLDEIIQLANKEYYKWSDLNILDFQDWIKSLGYTDDYSVRSNVKTVEQLKDEH